MIKKIISRLLYLMPLKNIIIFESNPDFTDNTFWFFKYLVEEHDIQKKYKLVWFVGSESLTLKKLCGVPITCVDFYSEKLVDKIKRFYYLSFASYIIDCNKCLHKKRETQKRIYLGHGMPIKMPADYSNEIGECDLLLITGEIFRNYYEQFVSKNSIRNFGYPRNEILSKPINKQLSEKYIIWMPTFRQSKTTKSNGIENRFPLGLPVIKNSMDFDLINQCLKNNDVHLYLRPHPAQDISVLNITEMSHVHIMNDKFLNEKDMNLYEVISSSSALITDYSSVYYDYLLTGKPIALTLEDAEEFSKKWPLFFEDINTLVGNKLLSIRDLENFISEVGKDYDSFKKERKQFADKLGIEQKDSSKLIYDYIFKK